jgi:hypothetical protein
MKVFTFLSIWLSTSGFKCQPPTFLVSRFFLVSTDARISPSVCGDLPMWSTVMRTTVLYYFICNAIYIQNVCISGIVLFISSRYVISCVMSFRIIHFILISTAHTLFLTCPPVSIYGT